MKKMKHTTGISRSNAFQDEASHVIWHVHSDSGRAIGRVLAVERLD